MVYKIFHNPRRNSRIIKDPADDQQIAPGIIKSQATKAASLTPAYTGGGYTVLEVVYIEFIKYCLQVVMFSCALIAIR